MYLRHFLADFRLQSSSGSGSYVWQPLHGEGEVEGQRYVTTSSEAVSTVPAQVCEPLLAAIIVSSQPGGRATAARLWQVNPDVVVRTVTGLYERDPRAEVLAAVLDVCQPVRSALEQVP